VVDVGVATEETQTQMGG